MKYFVFVFLCLSVCLVDGCSIIDKGPVVALNRAAPWTIPTRH